ncbi:hypothetical protein AX760_07685 [Pararhizobium antarcticum]|uniref:Uncharacterized protein n=1 Tax=Pararhizobium antarcticum TaxID=1798805 RepID=A0A657LQ12_9HYPH|nr:hypothetical protein AX760_07685 [Pararhizobium antarcticum]OJF98567.1 hypothetical protein AX761_02270 [Rhizobium sp. 58]
MKMMRSDTAASGFFQSGVFKRVYERQIKPLEVFCVARRQCRTMKKAYGGDHGIRDGNWSTGAFALGAKATGPGGGLYCKAEYSPGEAPIECVLHHRNEDFFTTVGKLPPGCH